MRERERERERERVCKNKIAAFPLLFLNQQQIVTSFNGVSVRNKPLTHSNQKSIGGARNPECPRERVERERERERERVRKCERGDKNDRNPISW